jgi:hypothetical protein
MSLRRRSQAGTDAAAAVDQLEDLVGMTSRIEALLERAAANPHARGVADNLAVGEPSESSARTVSPEDSSSGLST